MLEQHGNIWDMVGQVDIICITTNLCFSGDRAVMGAGIAKQALDRYPGCNLDLGRALAVRKTWPLKIAVDGKTEIWSFATKKRQITTIELLPYYRKLHATDSPTTTYPGWMGYSDLQLILDSAASLKVNSGSKTVALPRPGCGKGGLEWDQVKLHLGPILNSDRFTIFC